MRRKFHEAANTAEPMKEVIRSRDEARKVTGDQRIKIDFLAGTKPAAEGRRCRVSRRRERGVALIGVLWIGFLLIVVGTSVLYGVRVQSRTSYNLQQNAAARAIADAGVVLAIRQLRVNLTDESWRGNGVWRDFEMRDGSVRVSIQDEGGKIDLNRARDGLLKGLFLANGVAEEDAAALVDAIVDWRDSDDLKRLNGAEDSDYRNAGLPYGAKDRRFERVGELRRVFGMTAELYRRVAPALTVHSGSPGVDPEVALPAVMRAVMVASGETVKGFGADAGALDPDGFKAGAADRSMIGRSARRAFTIRAVGRPSAGAVFVREAVVRWNRRGVGQFKVVEWRSGRVDGAEAAQEEPPVGE